MAFFFSQKRKKLLAVLEKLGLDLKEGSKHTKAECSLNGQKTTIPRHKVIKREVVKSICDFLLAKDFKEKDLLDLLK